MHPPICTPSDLFFIISICFCALGMMSFSIQLDKEVYEDYFRIADLNGDGTINYSEAIDFFCGSNLPRDVLIQICGYADQDERGFLDGLGFYNALKLISVAQRSGHLTSENINHALLETSLIPAPKIKTVNAIHVGDNEDSSETDSLSLRSPEFSESDISECDFSDDIEEEMVRMAIKESVQSAIRKGQYFGDLRDEVPEMAIKKASNHMAIQEGPCGSFEGTDVPTAGPSTPTIDASSLHESGANYVPILSISSAPSAPPLDYLSTESFLAESKVDTVCPTDPKSSQIEEFDNRNVNFLMCSICMEKPVEGAYIPCGHKAGCMGCLQKIKDSSCECPFCCTKIESILKLYDV